PTAAIAPASFYDKVVAFAKKHNIIVCHDAAYSEMYYDGEKSQSFFNAEGSKDVGIEMHSFSKTFNMTGWRIGYAVGHKDLIAGLASIKGNLDSGQFHAIQRAGIKALNLPEQWTNDLRKIYEARRNVLVPGLKSLGWSVNNPKATFYVWIRVPEKFAAANKNAKSISGELVKFILQNCGIVSTPGAGFGKYGEGYIRMTICTTEERLKEAVKRLKEKCLF
ncbi:MAG: aminotransferase class I/II-fold pyridoxal phosphate-dependent enzyme, partial [Candidatus Firestonebacteria bacterium]